MGNSRDVNPDLHSAQVSLLSPVHMGTHALSWWNSLEFRTQSTIWLYEGLHIDLGLSVQGSHRMVSLIYICEYLGCMPQVSKCFSIWVTCSLFIWEQELHSVVIRVLDSLYPIC